MITTMPEFSLPNLTGQRVLITGGLGFIGSNLAIKCLQLGASVTIYDCLDPRSGGNIHNIDSVQDDVEIIVNDIRNFEGICDCIRKKDYLFNCAGYTSHPYSMKDPLTDIEVNCMGNINVLEAARRFNPTIKIIHVGTSTQIGKLQYSPADEKHPEFPVDIYSANKTASEKYMLIYSAAYDIWVTVIRIANVFGPRSNIKSPDFGFVNYFVGLALQNKEITIFGEGTQLRNISYVDDCVNALLLSSQKDSSKGEVFFAVNDSQISVRDITRKIVNIIGGRVKHIEWPEEREVIEIGDAIITNQRIKDIVGWYPKNAIEHGLEETKDFYSTCLAKYI